MTADLSGGQAFGPYHIAGTAGSGGMAIVYRAEQRSLARVVALKVIRPDISESGDYRSRFLREARLAAAVDHPHVVSVFDVGEHAGRLYLTMQWVDGEDLRTLLDRQQRLDPGRTVLIGTQMAGALQAVHQAGLVHRDVKPSNVLVRDLGGRDHAYLTDFGIAKMPGAQDDLTRTGWSVGTPGYLSPEQIRGQRPGPASDLYALACVLFETLTGRRPFGGENDMVMQWAHLSSPRPVASAMCPDLGRRYDGFFARALAVDARERFTSGRAFADALQAAHAGRYDGLVQVPAGEGAQAQPTVWATEPPAAASRPSPLAPARSGPAAPGDLDRTWTRRPTMGWPPPTPPQGPARPAGRSGSSPAGAVRPGPGQPAAVSRSAGAGPVRGRAGASPLASVGRLIVVVGALLFAASLTLLTRYTNNGTGWKSLWQATHHDPASPLVASDFWILIALAAVALVFTAISAVRRLAVIVAGLGALAAAGYTVYLPMKGTSPGFHDYGASYWLSLAATAVMLAGAALALSRSRRA